MAAPGTRQKLSKTVVIWLKWQKSIGGIDNQIVKLVEMGIIKQAAEVRFEIKMHNSSGMAMAFKHDHLMFWTQDTSTQHALEVIHL